MKISVAIIAFNEADRIGDALESCRGVADEIVVVDSFSTDRTVEIARDHGARVCQHVFTDFGSQKNFALDEARYEWVFNLDADERLSGELREEILRLKTRGEEIAAACFSIKRKTFYLGRWIRHSGWYPDRKVRLFKKEKSRWSGRVHEALRVDGEMGRLDGDILHYTYRDIDDHIKRMNRYSAMQAEDMVNRGKKCLYLRFLILPGVTFFRFYIWKLGIMDGLPGLVIALVSSWATAMKYMKAIAIKREGLRHSVIYPTETSPRK